MAFCSKCGKELADGAKFCAGCGTPVGGAENEAKNFNAEEAAKAAGEKAKAAGGKVKGFIDKLPFNGMAQKVPALAKVAGYANYAACALGILLVVVVVAVATPDKGEKQAKGSSNKTEKVAKNGNAKPSGNIDKALNGEWIRIEKEVYSFDKGKFTYIWAPDGPGSEMCRGTYETKAGAVDPNGNKRDDISWVFFTWKEDYNFETGKWVSREKPGSSELVYKIYNDDKLRLGDTKDANKYWEYERGTNLKELTAKAKASEKKMAEIKSMSADKLKKQAAAPEADFEVEPADDSFTGIVITKYKGKEQLVVIPATMQGLPVKRIKVSAFDTQNIVAVVIPEGVTYVSGFNSCKNLSSVVLPSTLKVIGDGAFEGCSSLKSIDLPEGLLYIDCYAFYISGLTSINLPKSLRVINYAAFTNCNSLAEIQIPAGHSIIHGLYNEGEHSFEDLFSGTKIKESIILQKLLKDTKTHAISDGEYESLTNDIAKQIGVKSIRDAGSYRRKTNLGDLF